MNTPPPRHAPLSIPTSHFSFPAIEHEDGKDENYTSTSPHNYAERQTSLARLALASGTGEDVAAFDTPTKRPRLRLEGKSLRALALLLAVLLAGAWIYLEFDKKNIHEDAYGSPTVQPSSSQNVSIDNEIEAEQEIVVYISGAVATPGVYTLPASSRVNDCVKAAGGIKPDAQSAAINLASALSDGEHIHIPAQGENVSSHNNGEETQTTGETSGEININTANAAQLEELPGIGPSLSQTIIAWREDNGRFTRPEDLLEVSGIGKAKYDKLKNLVTVG